MNFDYFKNIQQPNQMDQIKQVMKLCGNRNPKEVFYELCKQMNVDPQVILNMLK